jgi:VWFA-related protein
VTRRAAAFGAAAVLAAAALAADPQETPKDVGLVEQASTRLAQLDVTVSGPKGGISGLTAADFEVRLNHKLVPNLLVDDLCVAGPAAHGAAQPEAPAEASTEASTPSPPGAEAGTRSVATYLLYFDMPHLTQSGRRGAIDAARDMLPKLLAGGQRAMIIVSAAELKTVVPLTSDVAQLEAALVKMTDDNSTFDTYASLEENRMSAIILELDRSIDLALNLASRFASEERWKQEKELRRLSMVLGRLSELDSPKSVLYFADTMRQNAGEHYLSFFGGTILADANGKAPADAQGVRADAAMGALPLDNVMNEASGLGIRFYTIEGQGMTGTETFIQSRTSPSGGGGGNPNRLGNNAQPGLNSQRTRDAQTTLGSLAAETGGRSFINGVSPAKMAAQILGDMSCVYLLSFDPKGFPQDQALTVSVEVKRPNVKSTTRGRLVIQSESTRVTGRVLSAFAAPTATGSTAGGVRVGVIPISYADGHFTARVQVTVSGSTVPVTTWDLGASLVSKGVVWQDGSGRIQVSLPNTPVIYEKDMDFAPGDYDLVAVAHEVQTDTVSSKEVHGSWPKLDAELASLGPIAVSQPRSGGFLRNGHSRTQGAVVVSEDESLRGDSPTAVIALVCRAKDQKRPLKVVRTLVGETSTPVGSTDLDLTTDRCGQIVDLIPSRMLGSGTYHFVITVTSDGNELARGDRTLVVPDKAPAPSPPPVPPAGAS